MTECIKCDDEAIGWFGGDPLCQKHASLRAAKRSITESDL